MLKIKLDVTPLKNAHGGRGIGMYTRMLAQALKERSDVELVPEEDTTTVPGVIHYPFFDLFFSTLPFKKVAPTVVTIHDVIPLMFPEQYKAGFKGTARLARQRLSLRSTKAIITDSVFSKEQIIHHLRLKSDRITVVPLAADPALQRPAPSVIDVHLQKFSLPEKYVLYVGDINYNKNIPQLIKMLKFLPDEYHLVCVGANFKPQPIPEWQWIETQMAMSDVEARVHFISDVPVGDTEAISSIYAGATVYVQPSLAEGFGLPLLEAMQCKTPVVSSDATSLPEVGGESVLYAKPEAEALAEKVEEIGLWSENRRRTFVKAAYEHSQTFSWSKAAAETAAVYEKARHEK